MTTAIAFRGGRLEVEALPIENDSSFKCGSSERARLAYKIKVPYSFGGIEYDPKKMRPPVAGNIISNGPVPNPTVELIPNVDYYYFYTSTSGKNGCYIDYCNVAYRIASSSAMQVYIHGEKINGVQYDLARIIINPTGQASDKKIIKEVVLGRVSS